MLFTQVFRDDSPRPSASGEWLNFESLAPNEMICVFREDVGCRGETFFREYRVIGGTEPTFQAFKAYGTVPKEDEKEIFVRQLSAKQVRGLDATLTLLRKTPKQYCSALFKYTFSYFRGENKVGEEVFINNMAILHLNDFYAQRNINKDQAELEFANSASDYGLQQTDIDNLVTVEMLAENRPNKEPVQTATPPGNLL
jgi:hypothetical protein